MVSKQNTLTGQLPQAGKAILGLAEKHVPSFVSASRNSCREAAWRKGQGEPWASGA